MLEDKDVNHQDLVWESSPSTLVVMAELIDLNGEPKISLNYCGGNAARLLARFSDGDVEMASLIKEIINKECEANKGVILAEIIHLPRERTGNILRRPNFRKYEIPYLASCSVSSDNQIPLQDLDVQLVNNTIILYSRSRNTRVIPKLTNAHNFGLNDTPVYHFLCDLQYQNKKAFGFSWGPVRIVLDFLPRLEYRNLIISKAQWKITKEELISVLGNEMHVEIRKLNRWRKNRNIPKQVQVLEGDNKLCINFTNYDSLDILISAIENKSSIWVEEFLLTPDRSLVNGEQGKYSSEIIIPFYLN